MPERAIAVDPREFDDEGLRGLLRRALGRNPADAIGIAGTLFLYRDRVRIVAGRFTTTQGRLFERGAKSTTSWPRR